MDYISVTEIAGDEVTQEQGKEKSVEFWGLNVGWKMRREEGKG